MEPLRAFEAGLVADNLLGPWPLGSAGAGMEEISAAPSRPLPAWERDMTRETRLGCGAFLLVCLWNANVMRVPERESNSGGLTLHRH
jgi:hypothetical protein